MLKSIDLSIVGAWLRVQLHAGFVYPNQTPAAADNRAWAGLLVIAQNARRFPATVLNC